MAAKKPVSKAAKAVKKTSKPATRPAAAKSVARKPAAKKSTPAKATPAKSVPAKGPTSKVAVRKAAPAKPLAKRPIATPAKVPATKKPVASRAPARPAGKVAGKSPSPAKQGATRPASGKSMSAKSPAAKSIGREALSGAVKVVTPKQPQSHGAANPSPRPVAKPVAKPVSKELAKQATSASRPVTAPRPVGKVAVAVAARPSAPARKDKYKVIPYKTDTSTGRPVLPSGYRPHPDEEYMGPLQTEYFRQRLFSWRADLVEESKQTIENLKDEVRDVGDEAERATRETENSLELRTRDRYRKLIGKIDSTLKRVDAGEYGYSVDSGEEIGLERLEARLTAERTIDEQERWEHLQKQIGD